MKTIKQYAEEQGVSYEAIRKQIGTYREDLKEHIIVKGRTQYLDDWAVNFLTERRKENSVILINQDKADEAEALRQQIETLRTQLHRDTSDTASSCPKCPYSESRRSHKRQGDYHWIARRSQKKTGRTVEV